MISNQVLKTFLASLPRARILVIGDIILDHYLHGQVNRISPEAPVPILLSEKEEYRLGGAGNVFLNLTALGAQATLAGVLGNDEAGEKITELTSGKLLALTVHGRVTPVKTRLIAHRQQILRIDRETTQPISDETTDALLGLIDSREYDAILLSDYAKGTLNRRLVTHLVTQAHKQSIPVIADPKPINIDLFHRVTAITPNRQEAESILGAVIDNDEQAARAAGSLMKRLQTQMAIITRGAQGVSARQRLHQPFHLPAFSHEVFDVTGAGDTFAAILVLGMVSGLTIRQTLWLANAASSLVIERIGAATLTPDELFERCQRLKNSGPRPR
jgi:D-beta-D-heptose 7-phosphate kinase/D-beta-D-heptose 1-phosphate adenosyltransferase